MRFVLLLFVVGVSVQADSNTLFFERHNGEIICPDKQGSCPADATCCQLSSGKYACCPLPEALCCSDHLHCCPNGYKCDLEHQECVGPGRESVAWYTKADTRPLTSVGLNPSNIVCPDQSSFCPTGQTCCQLGSGAYGCCPMANAVCCSDHLHCCPSGYTCDVAESQCRRGSESVSWFEKKVAETLNNITCPDKSKCPNGQTCCQQKDSSYNCCPIPSAYCCTDKVHCCPHGYTCNSSGYCSKGSESIPWFEKQASQLITEDVTCPDGSSCQDGQTCCQMPDGSYGCCPLPSAVCCSDQQHCCPQGYTCDVAEGNCNKGSVSVSWSVKLQTKKATAVQCPDKISTCDDGFTCCQLSSGVWGCCPFANAICCSDHLHCCPNGNTCDVAHTRCVGKSEVSVPWFSSHDNASMPGVIQCGKDTYCNDGQTCCKEKGTPMCCPYPDASCCRDGVHCCKNHCWWNKCYFPDGSTAEATKKLPAKRLVLCADKKHACLEGFTCNDVEGTCVKKVVTAVPWASKVSATRRPNVCPDTHMKCKNGSTCCQGDNGISGCCPFENGVCCSDGNHCCPSGTSCDLKTHMCQSNTESMAISMSMTDKRNSGAAEPEKKAAIQCPDNTSCPGATTCCQMQNNRYSCCQYANATCCPDKLHCCPSGYKCDVKDSSCIQDPSDTKVPWDLFTRRRARVDVPSPPPSVVCPTETHNCPSNNSCCQSQDEDGKDVWSCCPYPNASCCAGSDHCCPEGFSCDNVNKSCIRSSSMKTLEKSSRIP